MLPVQRPENRIKMNLNPFRRVENGIRTEAKHTSPVRCETSVNRLPLAWVTLLAVGDV